MGQIQFTLSQINALHPLEIAEHPSVREKFTQIYETLWGDGEAAWQRESLYFNKILREADNGRLQRATPFSIFCAFVDLAVCGLSLENGARPLAYLIGRNVNVGTREKPVWEGRCVLTISAYGELMLRIRAKQIRHADNPVIVYANDDFSFSDTDGRKSVSYKCNLPHEGVPTACYIRITRNDGSIDYSVILPEDWARLAAYSEKQNRGSANTLYGKTTQGTYNIDPGFLQAKCIKHAFKTYPKLPIGKSTDLQDLDAAPEPVDYYNVDTTTGEVFDTPPVPPTIEEKPSIAPPQMAPAGVTISDEDDGAF